MALASSVPTILRLADWEALEHDPLRPLELVRGVPVVLPRPVVTHQHGIYRLCRLLEDRLPAELIALPEVEVLLEGDPRPTARTPDVIVVRRDLLRAHLPRAAAADVVLAVEVLSPGTARTDTVTTLVEYADAGIGAYWIVDLDPPVTLTAHVLVDGDYEITAKASGDVDLLTPVPLTLPLDRLRP